MTLHIETHHKTFLKTVGGALYHGNTSDEDVSSDVTPVLWDFDIIDVGEGSFALRRNGFYASAEPGKPQLSLDRLRIGPWERFRARDHDKFLISPARKFEQVPIAGSPHYSGRPFGAVDEIFSTPLHASAEDLAWYQDSTIFYPIKPGRFCSENELATARNKILTTKHMAHGVLFDESGFFNNHGFIYVNNYAFENLSVDPTTSKIFVDIESVRTKHRLDGSFLLTFDGNSFNYYHFLIEGLVQLFMLREAGLRHAPILCVDPEARPPFQKEYFDLLGINGVLEIDGKRQEIIAIEEVHFIKHNGLPHTPAAAIRGMAEALKRACNVGDSPRHARLYIKRKPGQRSVKNQLQVEAALDSLGFEAVDLQGLSVATQIQIFSEAAMIIGPHGAGMANIIFCQPGAVIVDLIPSEGEVRNFFWLLAEKVGVFYSFLRCKASHGYGGDLTVDVEELKTLVETISDHLNERNS